MKKAFIISALFLGFTFSGMSQSSTSESSYEQLMVISKDSFPVNLNIYDLRNKTTGFTYESLPIAAQLQIGEIIIATSVGISDDEGSIVLEDENGNRVNTAGTGGNGSGYKTIVENERTGLLFLKGK